MLKKLFAAVIVILIMIEFIPFLYKSLYGDETIYYNAMPGETVIGKDPNGGFITKPTNSTAIAEEAQMEKFKKFVIVTVIVAAVLAAILTALYKFNIFNRNLDIVLVLVIIIATIYMIGMTVNEGIKIVY